MTHVSIKNLTKVYPGLTVPSLDNLSLEINREGKIYSMEFSNGSVKKKLKIIGDSKQIDNNYFTGKTVSSSGPVFEDSVFFKSIENDKFVMYDNGKFSLYSI